MASQSTGEGPISPFRSTRTTPEERQEKRGALLGMAKGIIDHAITATRR